MSISGFFMTHRAENAPKLLQMKWSDEDVWRTVRVLKDDERDDEVLRDAKIQQRHAEARYRHAFTAEFRIQGSAV